jgi:chitodextrinase
MATTSGKRPRAVDVARSARPRSPPPKLANTSQPDKAAKNVVTAAHPLMLTLHDGAGARRATKSGQTAVVKTQLAAKARWTCEGPAAGSGELATPNVHNPVAISSRRAGSPIPVRPTAVASCVAPTRTNAPVMIQRSVPG